MAITALTDVETLEVSLVPNGANNKKRFPIFKKAEEDEMSDILHAVIDAPSSEDNQFDKVLKSAEVNDETAQALKGAMKILNAYSDTIPAGTAVSLLAKGMGVEKQQDERDRGEESEGTKLSDEDRLKKEEQDEFDRGEESEGARVLDKDEDKEFAEGEESEGARVLDKEDEEFAEGEESEGTRLYDEDKMASKSLQKSLAKLPADVRDQMTALWKSNEEEKKKRVALEKSLKVERDERLRKEYVTKAEKEFPHVPGKSPEELGIMLKTLAAVAPKIAEDLEGVFKSVSTTIEKADLFKEFGTSMDAQGSNANAYAKMDTMAKEAVAKSGGSYAIAFEQVMKSNPELYNQYLEEQGQ